VTHSKWSIFGVFGNIWVHVALVKVVSENCHGGVNQIYPLMVQGWGVRLKKLNFTKFADINLTDAYPLHYSYKIFRVCGQFHALWMF